MADRAKIVSALVTASDEVLRRVEDVLKGRESRPADVAHHLLTIGEAQKYLRWKYGKVCRAIDDGLLDTVDVMGRRHVTEKSLVELVEGKRQPSAEAIRRREERNKMRREAYHSQRLKPTAA